MFEEVKSYSEIRKEFYYKYKTKIVPQVRQYESERKKKYTLALILSVSLAVLGIILLVCAFVFVKSDNDGIIKLSFGAFALSYFSWFLIKKSFTQKEQEV